MASLRAVTLDCAGTLIRVDWQPSRFAVECAGKVGLELDAGHAQAVYDHLLGTRWGHYQQLNQTRDESVLDDFWWDLTEDWLREIGAGVIWTEAIVGQAMRDLYGPESQVFGLFEDSRNVLECLRQRGVKIAALSNWDYSLHRVLRLLGIRDLFDVVVASLEEGVEKPEKALFDIALSRLEVAADEAWHVGDDPIDDVQGARNAGMRATLLDRGGIELLPLRISGLDRLTEALDWTG